MKLFLILQTENDDYDTYDSAVVAAETEEDARLINPDGKEEFGMAYSSWCKTPDDVTVKYLGIAAEGTQAGIILGSFNAG